MGRGRNPSGAAAAATTTSRAQAKANKSAENFSEKELPDDSDESSQDSGSRKTRRSLPSPKEQIPKVKPKTEIGSNIRSRLRRSTQINNISLNIDEDKIEKEEIVVGAEECVVSEDISLIYSRKLEKKNERMLENDEETDESSIDTDRMLAIRSSYVETPIIPDSNEATCCADDFDTILFSIESETQSSGTVEISDVIAPQKNSKPDEIVIEIVDSLSQDDFDTRMNVNYSDGVNALDCPSITEFEDMNVHVDSQSNKTTTKQFNEFSQSDYKSENNVEDKDISQLDQLPLPKTSLPIAAEIPLEERALPSPDFFNLPKPKIIRTYRNKRKLLTDESTQVQECIDNKSDSQIINKTMIAPQPEVTEKLGFADNSSDGTECRRSQRKKVMKYDVRDLLNKKGSRTQMEMKAKQAQLQKVKELTRNQLVTSPQVFKGFSDTEDRLSPVINTKRASPRISNNAPTSPCSPSVPNTTSTPAQSKIVKEPTVEDDKKLRDSSIEETVAQPRPVPIKSLAKKTPAVPRRILPRRKTALFNRLPDDFEFSAEDSTDEPFKGTSELEMQAPIACLANSSQMEKEVESKSFGRQTRNNKKGEGAAEKVDTQTKKEKDCDQILSLENKDVDTTQESEEPSITEATSKVEEEKMETTVKSVEEVKSFCNDQQIAEKIENVVESKMEEQLKEAITKSESLSNIECEFDLDNVEAATKSATVMEKKIIDEIKSQKNSSPVTAKETSELIEILTDDIAVLLSETPEKEIKKTDSNQKTSKAKARTKRTPNNSFSSVKTKNSKEQLEFQANSNMIMQDHTSIQPDLVLNDVPKTGPQSIKILEKYSLATPEFVTLENTDSPTVNCKNSDDQKTQPSSNLIEKELQNNSCCLSKEPKIHETAKKSISPKIRKSEKTTKNKKTLKICDSVKEIKINSEEIKECTDLTQGLSREIQEKDVNDSTPKKKIQKMIKIPKTNQQNRAAEKKVDMKTIPKTFAEKNSSDQGKITTPKNGCISRDKKINKRPSKSTVDESKAASSVEAKGNNDFVESKLLDSSHDISDQDNSKDSFTATLKTSANKMKNPKNEFAGSLKTSTKRIIEEVNIFASDSSPDSPIIASKSKRIPKKKSSLAKKEMKAETVKNNYNIVETVKTKIKKIPKIQKQTSDMNSIPASDSKFTSDKEKLAPKIGQQNIGRDGEMVENFHDNLNSFRDNKITESNIFSPHDQVNKQKKTQRNVKTKAENIEALDISSTPRESPMISKHDESLNDRAAHKTEIKSGKKAVNENSMGEKFTAAIDDETTSSESSIKKKTKAELKFPKRPNPKSQFDINSDTSNCDTNSKADTKPLKSRTEKISKRRESRKSIDLTPTLVNKFHNIPPMPEWKPPELPKRPELPGPMVPPVLNGLSSSMMNDLLQWACNNTQALSKIKRTVDQNQRMASPEFGLLGDKVHAETQLSSPIAAEYKTQNENIGKKSTQSYDPISTSLQDVKKSVLNDSNLSPSKGNKLKESLQMLIQMSSKIRDIEIPEDLKNTLKNCKYKIDNESVDLKNIGYSKFLTNKLQESEIREIIKRSDVHDSALKSTKSEQTDQHSHDDKTNIRRSHRIKTQVKSNIVGRGLVRDKDVFKSGNDRNHNYSSTLNLAEHNAKFLKDMEERLSQFQVIKENEYKCERIISKEAKKMTCDCFLTRDEEDRGELGCGEDCLNRLLMIECTPKCTVGERCTNRRFQRNQYAPCKVFRTEKKGFGIMADDEIVAGEFIMEYVGEVLNGKQFEKRANIYSQDKNKHYYFMALRSDSIIDATGKGNISRFINHSCDPNAETQKWTVNGELRIGFFSKRRISLGEEITFDYQFQRYGKEAQKCFCETANCRGWIGEEPDSEDEEELASESDEEVEPEIETKLPEDVAAEKIEIEKIDQKKLESAEQVSVPPDSGKLEIDEKLTKEISHVELPKPLVKEIVSESTLDKPATTKAALKAAEKLEKVALKLKAKRERERIKQQNRMVMEDPDLDEDIISLNHSGLKNQVHTLKLSRCMVRAKSLQTRIRLLEILQKGEMACRRLFLDYHGLRLLHGWMSETETIDIEQDLEFRLMIVETLELLPIPNKTMLKESKVFQTVQNWSSEIEQENSLSYSPTDSESSSPPSKRQKSDNNVQHPVRMEIKQIASKLIASWEILPEVFRIPKRERIEQMKEHEREANRQYKALNLTDDYHDHFQKQRRNKERFGIMRRSYKWMREKSDWERKGKDSGQKDWDKVTRAEANLSKLQRRQLFAAKVAKDEAEKRLAEERREFEIKCRFYGIDPKFINARDLPFCVHPATGQWYSQDKRKIPTPPSHAHIKVPPKPQSTDPKDYKMPEMDLPPLWKFAMDTCGRVYYYHIKIRIPQWEPPIKILPLTSEAEAADAATDTSSKTSGAGKSSMNEPQPGTSKQIANTTTTSLGPNSMDSSSSDLSDSDMSCSEIIGLKNGIPGRPGKESVQELRLNRKRKRYNLLVQERTISPRREEDRLYNQNEMRRYRENKEKLRRRKEEIKRRKALLIRRQQETPSTSASTVPSTGVMGPICQIESLGKPQQYKKAALPLPPVVSPPPESISLPIQDYLISSDEDDLSKSDYDFSLIEKIVHGDKIVDEFDALNKEKLIKRALPVKDRPEYKKRVKLDDKKSEKITKPRKSIGESGNNKYQARKAKEKFRSDIAGIIVHHLTPYRRDSCMLGRITTNEDFKHLARKLTHFVLIKELKHCESTGQSLIVTESVKNKSREFIKKYMAKYGDVYIRPENDPEFKDIPL